MATKDLCTLPDPEIIHRSFAANYAAQDDKFFSDSDFMRRPRGVIALAALFALAAVYLCAIAVTLLISPGAVSLMAAKHFMYGLELAGPYMILIGGGVYGIVAWGLFRLKNWARWVAILVVAFSIAPLVEKISTAELGVLVFWYGLQIALHVAVGWYLAQAPSVLDAFTPQRHGSTQILTDKPKGN